MLEVKFNYENGGIESIVNSDDENKMNWVDGKSTWGLIKDGEHLRVDAVNVVDGGIDAVYYTKHLEVKAQRRIYGDVLHEKYTFKSALGCDVMFNRGGVGIYATFNDSYSSASICMKKRCNTHLWCALNSSYINAVKMGPCDFGLALVLTAGSLDTYSVERDPTEESNDRGDFILHPTPFALMPGETMSIEWELFFYKNGELRQRLNEYPSIISVDSEYFTRFVGQNIEFSVNRGNASVMLDGKDTEVKTAGNCTYVCYAPERLGHHEFIISARGVTTKAEFFVQMPFRELARRRAEFIVKHQQYNRPGSALDGAYLIYDNQDKCVIFDNLNGDYNASRERLVMGLFIAKYLQYEHDPVIYDSLMKYYRFITREFYDEDTGEVYNTIGKDPSVKRLYNAPWMSLMTMEMYKLTNDPTYLDKMFKLLEVYYSIGGERFYPNGISMYETVDVLRKAGKTDKAGRLIKMYEKHVANIVMNGTNYPEHEVRYEQTIVSPAAMLTAQMYMLNHDPKLLEECKRHIEVLERFNGSQPSHYLNDLAIRHWDAFYFGKRRIYGDTFPHTASVHTSNAFLHYSMISGDREYERRAYSGAFNSLSLFNPDGSASCTRNHPLTINGVRGEYYDEFANEQDGYLYFMIKYFGMLERG